MTKWKSKSCYSDMRLKFVLLTGWGGECVLIEGDSSFGLAWLVTSAPQTFPFHSGAVTLSHPPVRGWEWGGCLYPVWIRRAGCTCIPNLHGLSLGLPQTLASLEWLCLIFQGNVLLDPGSQVRNQPLITANYLPPFPEESLFPLPHAEQYIPRA